MAHAARARSVTAVEAAQPHHLDAIVEITRAARRDLARWSPTYFNPSSGADDLHAAWLGFLVASPDHDTRVALDASGDVAAFAVVNPLVDGVWLDDLAVRCEADWADAGPALITSVDARPAITCVSVHDRTRASAFADLGWAPMSRYWAIGATSVGRVERFERDNGTWTRGRHTFAGGELSADAGGALVVDGPHGVAIGSPSVTPPIYDPGGPTCVVDRMDGSDRAALLQEVATAAVARGDHQVVVVSHVEDHGLDAMLEASGFEAHVVVYGARTLPRAGSLTGSFTLH
jgi:hypothetical protein